LRPLAGWWRRQGEEQTAIFKHLLGERERTAAGLGLLLEGMTRMAGMADAPARLEEARRLFDAIDPTAELARLRLWIARVETIQETHAAFLDSLLRELRGDPDDPDPELEPGA
jgi:hypothetical protein